MKKSTPAYHIEDAVLFPNSEKVTGFFYSIKQCVESGRSPTDAELATLVDVYTRYPTPEIFFPSLTNLPAFDEPSLNLALIKEIQDLGIRIVVNYCTLPSADEIQFYSSRTNKGFFCPGDLVLFKDCDSRLQLGRVHGVHVHHDEHYGTHDGHLTYMVGDIEDGVVVTWEDLVWIGISEPDVENIVYVDDRVINRIKDAILRSIKKESKFDLDNYLGM